MASIVIIGAGGHAKVLLDCLSIDKTQILGVLDSDRTRWGQVFHGYKILGDDDKLGELKALGATHFIVAVGSVGFASARKKIYELCRATGLSPMTVKHSSAICSPNCEISEGAQILPGSIINSSALIGENAIINSGAIVEHDCVIGAHTHVASGAVLSGAVRVGQGVHVGAGAIVRQNIRIGDRATVGAGAVVVKDVTADTLVVGVPARPMEKRK